MGALEIIRSSTGIFKILLRNGSAPPLLWHYFQDSLYYLLISRGVLRGPAAHISQVRADFEQRAKQGQFRRTWFDHNITQWCVVFARTFQRTDPVRILEIGSYEGRSTVFLLTYFPNGTLTAVDTWAGSDEHVCAADGREGDNGLQSCSRGELLSLESRFDANLEPFAGRMTKIRGSSLRVLPQLLDEKQEFDLIYVDGSHFADDVLADGINAWRLLTPNGVLIFDDLVWNFYPRAHDNPAWPVNILLKFHSGKYKILSAAGNQLLLKKLLEPTERAITASAWPA
ncbi:class I SAM-dependent methyltransferase [Mycobacterium sp. DL592]|uniref:class I SAM-dependent methyltransferase n=1 Tax=Mycobacterium sp. DL592 TaxID=2675524 RepID=UPI00141EAE85|nr:class I SAM-dependent methyltransferase [Mycobacterium sp. DL592]